MWPVLARKIKAHEPRVIPIPGLPPALPGEEKNILTSNSFVKPALPVDARYQPGKAMCQPQPVCLRRFEVLAEVFEERGRRVRRFRGRTVRRQVIHKKELWRHFEVPFALQSHGFIELPRRKHLGQFDHPWLDELTCFIFWILSVCFGVDQDRVASVSGETTLCGRRRSIIVDGGEFFVLDRSEEDLLHCCARRMKFSARSQDSQHDRWARLLSSSKALRSLIGNADVEKWKPWGTVDLVLGSGICDSLPVKAGTVTPGTFRTKLLYLEYSTPARPDRLPAWNSIDLYYTRRRIL